MGDFTDPSSNRHRWKRAWRDARRFSGSEPGGATRKQIISQKSSEQTFGNPKEYAIRFSASLVAEVLPLLRGLQITDSYCLSSGQFDCPILSKDFLSKKSCPWTCSCLMQCFELSTTRVEMLLLFNAGVVAEPTVLHALKVKPKCSVSNQCKIL